MSDITDAGPRLRAINDALAEIERLREAIRRLAGQDATLSVCDGNVTVTMDAVLTDAERDAIEAAARMIDAYKEEADGFWSNASTALRGLLKRLGGGVR